MWLGSIGAYFWHALPVFAFPTPPSVAGGLALEKGFEGAGTNQPERGCDLLFACLLRVHDMKRGSVGYGIVTGMNFINVRASL